MAARWRGIGRESTMMRMAASEFREMRCPMHTALKLLPLVFLMRIDTASWVAELHCRCIFKE
jgi:hypothetical protein